MPQRWPTGSATRWRAGAVSQVVRPTEPRADTSPAFCIDGGSGGGIQRLAVISARRSPTCNAEREYVEEGGLLAYGSNAPDQWRRRATYVDKILKGAKPGDLPIQQPVKFDFLVNQKTARQLGLTIPPAILDLADEVIE